MKAKKLKALLPGVEVDVYQGETGEWHSAVLLDPDVWPDRDVLPKRGNRPLVDESTRRWWYDESQGLYDYQPDSPRTLVHYTPNEAREMLNRKLAALLVELAGVGLATMAAKYMASVPHRTHWRWADRQDQRRQDHLRDGLPASRPQPWWRGPANLGRAES